MKKEAMNSNERRGGVWDGLMGRKGRRKCNIIISKIKLKEFKVVQVWGRKQGAETGFS